MNHTITIQLSPERIVQSVLATNALHAFIDENGFDTPRLLSKDQSELLQVVTGNAFCNIISQLSAYVDGVDASTDGDNMLSVVIRVPDGVEGYPLLTRLELAAADYVLAEAYRPRAATKVLADKCAARYNRTISDVRMLLSLEANKKLF